MVTYYLRKLAEATMLVLLMIAVLGGAFGLIAGVAYLVSLTGFNPWISFGIVSFVALVMFAFFSLLAEDDRS